MRINRSKILAKLFKIFIFLLIFYGFFINVTIVNAACCCPCNCPTFCECIPADCGIGCSAKEDPECGGCFTPDTKINTPGGEKEIKDIKVGDEVKSLIPDTGEEALSQVEDIHEVSQSAYYRIRTKDGRELKVTAEHPLWAIQSSDAEALADKKETIPLTFWEYLRTQSLTKKLLDQLF